MALFWSIADISNSPVAFGDRDAGEDFQHRCMNIHPIPDPDVSSMLVVT
jgi:hypothetical protein